MTDDQEVSQSTILGQPTAVCSFHQAMTDGIRLIDVRSPKEYAEGSLPRSVNVPLFDNEERCLVGTLYREGGRDLAIDTGFQMVEPRIQPLLDHFVPYRREKIGVFCARGGMRSRSVVNLLGRYGYDVCQLTGGYKAYRQELLAILERFVPRCIVLHGLTGTGKTRLLAHLPEMIDLEDLAQHQSSLFGGLNRRPRTQKWFDAHLHQHIGHLGPEPYFVEGESRQLGQIYLPSGLARAMKEGRLVLVEASIATRVQRILEDYPIEDEEMVVRVEKILRSLRRKLGGDIVQTLITYLHQDRLAELVEVLLVEYYDKRYRNVLEGYRYAMTLSSEDITEAAGKLVAYRRELMARGEFC